MKKLVATIAASAAVLAAALSVNWGAPQSLDTVNWSRPIVQDSVNWGGQIAPDSVNWGRVNWNGSQASVNWGAPAPGGDSVNWG